MPLYEIVVYEERMGTVVIEAADEVLAAEAIEAQINEHDNIVDIPTYDETSFEKGVAIDVSDPEEISLAMRAITNDS